MNVQLLLIALGLGFISQVLAIEQKTHKTDTIDVRIFLQDQHCNKRNANGNTFFYQLARDCNCFNYSEEIMPLLEEHLKNHRGHVPNPFIKHKKIINNQITLNTAKEEATTQLNDTGNPVCGFLKEFLTQVEIAFIDLSGSKKGREQMIAGTVPREQEHQ